MGEIRIDLASDRVLVRCESGHDLFAGSLADAVLFHKRHQACECGALPMGSLVVQRPPAAACRECLWRLPGHAPGCRLAAYRTRGSFSPPGGAVGMVGAGRAPVEFIDRRPLLPSGGHAWTAHGGIPICDRCGIVRRADGKNKPCPGCHPAISTRAPCTRSPAGWTCPRGANHEGPCAALPKEIAR